MLLSEIEDFPIMEEIQNKINQIEQLRKELIDLLEDASGQVGNIHSDDIEPDGYILEALADEDEEFDAFEAIEKAEANIEEYKGWVEGYEFDIFSVLD